VPLAKRNTQYRKNLPGTTLDYFDTEAAVEAIKPGAWATLPYTSRVHAENIVRKADPGHHHRLPQADHRTQA
jgi:aconitase A